MKNSMKYVTISLVMIFAVLFFTMARSFASGIQILPNGNGVSNRAENTNTSGNTATNTHRNNQAVNSPEAKENIVQVNQINDAEKRYTKNRRNRYLYSSRNCCYSCSCRYFCIY